MLQLEYFFWHGACWPVMKKRRFPVRLFLSLIMEQYLLFREQKGTDAMR